MRLPPQATRPGKRSACVKICPSRNAYPRNGIRSVLSDPIKAVIHSGGFIHRLLQSRLAKLDSHMRSNRSGGMKSLQQEEIGAALDAVDAGYARLRAACSDSVGNAFRVDLAERLERQHRINRGLMYRVFGELIEPPDGPDDPDLPAGTVISKLLWQRLRITSADIKHRIAIAARIRPRRSLTGPQLPPELPRLAAAVENGDLGEAPHRRGLQGRRRTTARPFITRKTPASRSWCATPRKQDSRFVAGIAQRHRRVPQPR